MIRYLALLFILITALTGCASRQALPARAARALAPAATPAAPAAPTPTPAGAQPRAAAPAAGVTTPPTTADAPAAAAPTYPAPTGSAANSQPTTPAPLDPLTIAYLRQRDYPGSDITIEQTLPPASNYKRYIASYSSDGLKIYALLTVPDGQKPASGWPAIVFNHGFIPPAQYRTTERYVAYVDAIARSGYIVFKPDFRGHGSSEGDPPGGYGSPAYTIDSLNALASVKRYPDADPKRIGMWGHSMGGQVTLRAMVVSQDIKAGVIWAGVVGSYPELLNDWHQPSLSDPTITPAARRWRQRLVQEYGTPQENPQFWASISPNTYVAGLSGPLQLDHGTADDEVPLKFSQELYAEVQAAGKTAELYTYPGSDHNISQGFTLAMRRTIAFFDQYVKGNPAS